MCKVWKGRNKTIVIIHGLHGCLCKRNMAQIND